MRPLPGWGARCGRGQESLQPQRKAKAAAGGRSAARRGFQGRSGDECNYDVPNTGHKLTARHTLMRCPPPEPWGPRITPQAAKRKSGFRAGNQAREWLRLSQHAVWEPGSRCRQSPKENHPQTSIRSSGMSPTKSKDTGLATRTSDTPAPGMRRRTRFARARPVWGAGGGPGQRGRVWGAEKPQGRREQPRW